MDTWKAQKTNKRGGNVLPTRAIIVFAVAAACALSCAIVLLPERADAQCVNNDCSNARFWVQTGSSFGQINSAWKYDDDAGFVDAYNGSNDGSGHVGFFLAREQNTAQGEVILSDVCLTFGAGAPHHNVVGGITPDSWGPTAYVYVRKCG